MDSNLYHNNRRKRRAKQRIFSRAMRITLFSLFALFVVVFIALLIKIYIIDTRDGDRFKKAALSQQSYTNAVLNYQRGAIKDRNNTTLAISVRKFNLVLEAKTLKADDTVRLATVQAISEFFGVDSTIITKKVDDNPKSMYLHFDQLKELSSEKVAAFKEMMSKEKNIKGVWFEETYKRNYPLNTVASSVVGFMSKDESGTYGVEEYYNDELCGTTGREYGYFDANMNLQRTVKEAKDGNTLVLTIDANVQQIIENQIKNFQEKNVGAKKVAVMLMNPNNGEILAMASDSTFNLNDPQNLNNSYSPEEVEKMNPQQKNEALLSMWSNFCIGSAYEPGSTFKPFTVAAGLDEHVITPNSTFVCGGVRKVADANIHCSNRSGHGTLDLRHGLMYSCNCALMDIGFKLGHENFLFYNDLYGFGKKTGVDLPGETSGLVHTADTLNDVELATSSFGQTQTVTMVQMISGFSSLINGGNYYQPHVVKRIENNDGDVVKEILPVVVKKTTTAKTSNRLKDYLFSTVEDGTASPAQVKGYEIGGKTGTAEKRPVSAKKYLVSFIGCVPALDPKVVVYVIIDEPNVADQAHSTYATQFASKIMKKVLPFLGLYSSEEKTKNATKNN